MRKKFLMTVIYGTAALSAVGLVVLAGLDHPFLNSYLEFLSYVLIILAGLYIFAVFWGNRGEFLNTVMQRPVYIGIITAILVYISGFVLDDYRNGILIKVIIFALGFTFVYAHRNLEDDSQIKELIKKFAYGFVLTLVVVTIGIVLLAMLYSLYISS